MLLLSALVTLSLVEGPSLPTAVEPWRHLHGWLSQQRDGMVRELEVAHGALLRRAHEADDEVARAELTDRPPELRPLGYGVLPEILPEQPPTSVQPTENRYSLKEISTAYAADFRDAALLARRAASDASLPLLPWVAEFRRLRGRLRNLEENLNYHARWQAELRAHRDWFEAQNRIVDRVRSRIARGQEDEPVRFDEFALFRPTAALRIEREADGGALLRLRVTTDIEDASYLEHVRRAVIAPFERAAEREGIRLRLDVQWLTTSPNAIYDPEPPPLGAPIDRERHLAHFPEEALVLTSGVEHTVAVTGRAVILGSGEIAPRVLAHEFGHLLGFDDAYLRGFEGDPHGAYGVVFVEWVGLFDDLMGNPGGGEVSRAMLERLLAAYGGE